MSSQFWLGSEASFETFEKAVPLAETRKQEWQAAAGENDMPDFPPLYERVGDVGIIKISGSLIPGQAEFMRYYGITGYADIKAAVLEGIADKGAKSLMIYSDSGGGSVAGVEDAEQFIANAAQVKPMSAYSEFSASAAYWLTSTAGHITTSSTGINGSLGVIRVVTEYSKAFEKDGITKTVMRAGRYKALGNPYEPLSEDAKAEIQSKLDDLYGIFINTVARNRGTTFTIADQVMGQGREFLGRRGLDVGLVDSVGDFDSALAYARGNRGLATRKPINFGASATVVVAQANSIADNAATSNQTGNPMKLTPEQLAAIAAGASVEEVTGKAGTLVVEEQAPVTPTPEAKAPEAETPKPEVKNDSEVVAFLKTELAAAQVETANAKAQAQTLAGQATTLQAEVASLSGIVQASIQSMHVALGKKMDTTKLNATELAAEHNSAKASMIESFKTGGLARSTASTQEKPAASLIAPRDAAAIMNMFGPR